MRAVICFNPKVPLEHYKMGRDYSEASLGFDYDGSPEDHKLLALHLRELADMLEAPSLADPLI